MVSFFDSHLKFQQKSKMKEPSNKWTYMPSIRNRERLLSHKPGSKCSNSGPLRSWIKSGKFLKELWCFSMREYNETVLVISRYPTSKSCGCKLIFLGISRLFLLSFFFSFFLSFFFFCFFFCFCFFFWQSSVVNELDPF